MVSEYLKKCSAIIEKVSLQEAAIKEASKWFASSIMAGRMVHVFGSGHSRIMVEEMWPRYGSFPGFNPIVELSLTFHNLVVGANGQRQAMYLENVSGLAERILRNFAITQEDTALIVSSSGCNLVPIEMAECFRKMDVRVVALLTKEHAEGSRSKRSDGRKLSDFANLVLDTGAPLGDAMVEISGMDTLVSPGSTVGGAMIINCLKAETAKILVREGQPPKVLTAEAVIGPIKSKELFESAYDEHAVRMAALFSKTGQ